MAVQVNCPHCLTPCDVPDGPADKPYQCGNCQKPFKLKPPGSAAPKTPPAPAKAAVKPLPAPTKAAGANAPKPAAPRPKATPAVDVLEIVDPKPKKRPRPAQDANPFADLAAPVKRPAPKKRSSGMMVYVGVGLVIVLLLGGSVAGGGAYVWYSRPTWLGFRETQTVASDNVAKPVANTSGDKPVAENKPAGTKPANSDKPAFGDKPVKSDSPGTPDIPPAKIDKPTNNDKPPVTSDKPVVADPKPPVGDLKATFLFGDTMTVPLPAPATDVAVGGGGRFIILHLEKNHQLLLFDVNAAKVVKELPLTEDKVLFAAGRDKLLVVLPEKKVVQRYSLETLTLEATEPLPPKGPFRAAAMGSASKGPLWLGGGAETTPLTMIDVPSLREIPLSKFEGGAQFAFNEFAVMRVSADNTLVGIWKSDEPPALRSVQRLGNGLQANYRIPAPPVAGVTLPIDAVLPTGDGQALCTARGLFTPEAKDPPGPKVERPTYEITLPAVEGSLYMVVTPPPQTGGPLSGIQVRAPSGKKPVAAFPTLDGLEAGVSYTPVAVGMTLDKRVLLIPQAKVLVTIPLDGKALILTKFDLDALLEKAKDDYLFVLNQPPGFTPRDKPYTHQVLVKSRKGNVQFKLDTAPPGMTVSKDGAIAWTVPADFKPADADVVLKVRDDSGQEVVQSFRVVLPARPAAADKPSLNSAVVKFCKDKLGEKVDDGECANLVRMAYKAAGAKDVSAFKDSPNPSDYVWGDLVYLFEIKGGAPDEKKAPGLTVQPGDVIQLRDARFEGKGYFMTAPHHTAVVSEVKEGGKVLIVLEQNANGKKIVAVGTYRLPDLKTGWLRIYRPVPK